MAPSLHGALLVARTAGHGQVNLALTPIRTDRSCAIGPAVGMDL